jgi:hypothetical protein
MNNSPRLSYIVRREFSELSTDELVKQPVSVLLGVSAEAEEVLKTFGISTLFDLGSSQLFSTAFELTELLTAQSGPMARFERVPAEWVDAGVDVTALSDLAGLPIARLRGVGSSAARHLSETLGVTTIYELANWAPYLAARSIIGSAATGEYFLDPEIPTELVPRFNQYSTDKFFYSIYMIDPVIGGRGLKPLTGAIDLAELEKKGKNLRVRTGAIVQYEQAWMPIGLSLGNLMHSLALAPGESTRIAMIDWSRRQGVRTSEDITQTESLANSLMHTRAVNEVTQAVAREAQTGMSQTNANSTVSNNAYSGFGLQNSEEALVAAGVGALAGGLGGAAAGAAGGAGIGAVAGLMGAGIGAIPGAIAGGAIGGGAGGLIGLAGGGVAGFLGAAEFGASQSNDANTRTEVVTATSSTGEKEFAASMAQNITDRTQQHSSATRNRRATIVQEVWQSESEEITTRAVTNYNHMHALTIQYFEVVQMYRVRTGAKQVDRALYVPMANIRWTPENIQRYRAILLRNALDFRLISALTLPPETVILTFPPLAQVDAVTVGNFLQQKEPDWGLTYARNAVGGHVANSPLEPWSLPRGVVIEDFRVGRYMRTNSQTSVFSGFEAFGAPAAPDTKGLPVSDVHRLEWILPNRDEDEDKAKPMLLDVMIRFSYRDQQFFAVCPLMLSLETYPAKSDEVVVSIANFGQTPDEGWLADHLKMFNKHYSRAVWRSVDESDIALLLSDYSFEGKPIINQIDRKPVAISGQYLVFKYHFKPATWEKWLAAHGFDTRVQNVELVPMPTGGVFAEAVQGRANSAEKLDITRFWNWQDSPIPMTAPEIAAIQSGSRAQDANVTPGQLQAPVVATMTPQALPDPIGLQVARDVMTASFFRDMSGIDATRQLASDALQQAQAGATAAGGQSAASLARGMEMHSKAIDKILTMFEGLSKQIASSGFGLLTGRASNIAKKDTSTAGAILNKAAEVDGKSGTAPGASGGGGGTSPGNDGSAGDTGGGGASSGSDPAGALPSSLERQGVETLVSGSGGFLPFGLNSLLTGIAGQVPADGGTESETQEKKLRGKDDGAVDLGTAMIDYLESLDDSESGACVAVSLSNFVNACKSAGAGSKIILGSIEVPLIAGASGGLIPLASFFYLWFSRADVGHWLQFPKKCRGAGAPGALLFADLVEGREYKVSKTGWPSGLKPGALMQLWDDEETYHRVRDVGGTSEFGHSLVFRGYGSTGNKIIVSDQMGLEREASYPILGMQYVIGANLKKAELI